MPLADGDESDGIYIIKEIKKDTVIGDILNIAPQTAPLYMAIGMHCLGCPHAVAESLQDACAAHGTNVDELVAQLNEFLAEAE